jgi:IS30 family transposase
VRWSEDDMEKALVEYGKGRSFSRIAKDLGRTRGAVAGALSREMKRQSEPKENAMTTKLKPRGNWTDYEDREIRKGVRAGHSAGEIAAHLTRMESSVIARTKILTALGEIR